MTTTPEKDLNLGALLELSLCLLTFLEVRGSYEGASFKIDKTI